MITREATWDFFNKHGDAINKSEPFTMTAEEKEITVFCCQQEIWEPKHINIVWDWIDNGGERPW